MKPPKTYVTVEMPLSEFAKATGHMCAWDGCTATSRPIDAPLPPGWRWLVLFRDTKDTPTFHEMLAVADRDAVLCPEHAGHLHNDLLKDIGQRLDKTEGNA